MLVALPRSVLVIVASSLLLIGFTTVPGCVQGDRSAVARTDARAKIVLGEDLQLEPLTHDIWRHVSYTQLPSFGFTPANGLIVCAGHEAVLVDTPWNDDQTARLCDWASRELDARVTAVIVTHAHGDCIGGLHEAHRRGAHSYALDKSVPIARTRGDEIPQNTFTETETLEISGKILELRYVGAGHTVDNIVVWIPDEKLLFGGCLVRSATANSLGNTAEADLVAWPATIRNLRQRYQEANLIVPGHGAPGGLKMLSRTLELLRQDGHE